MIGVTFFVLTGCNMGNENVIESSSVISSEDIEVSSESAIVKESEQSSTEEIFSQSSIAEQPSEKVVFVPQKSDLESGYTIENDEVLQEIDAKIKDAEVVGISDEVAIQFTGLYMGEEGNMKAVFIFVNRTDLSLTNIKMKISFGTSSGDVILDQEPFILSDKELGISEPNTAMPIYLAIPPEKEEVLKNIIDLSMVTNSIDALDYEVVE